MYYTGQIEKIAISSGYTNKIWLCAVIGMSATAYLNVCMQPLADSMNVEHSVDCAARKACFVMIVPTDLYRRLALVSVQ